MARDVMTETFENRNQAYAAARDIDKLDDNVINIDAGAIVEKDMLGNVTWLDTKDLTGPWTPSAAPPPRRPSSGRWSARSPARPEP